MKKQQIKKLKKSKSILKLKQDANVERAHVLNHTASAFH